MNLRDQFLIVTHTTIFADMAYRMSAAAFRRKLTSPTKEQYRINAAQSVLADEIFRIVEQVHVDRMAVQMGQLTLALPSLESVLLSVQDEALIRTC